MQANPIKARLADGGLSFGTMVTEFFTPGIMQLCKTAGAEFVMIDCEHGGAGIDTVKAQCAFARGLGVVPVVRVPDTQYHLIANALDAGAMGIMVPLVGTASQAEFIVSCTRYPPAGRRGAAFGMAHDDYEGGEVAAKIAALHERVMVIAMIETREGLENVDAIAAVPGVDVVWVGHFDLTNSMGIPGGFDRPEFGAALDRVAAAARTHGRTAGMMVSDDAWAARVMPLGYRMLAYGLDQMLFQRELSRGIGVLRELQGR
jgi:2-dehydro-3-deoxyglucarate aldolase/4-hydroxy-2-oxoheptanedioate aldolase